MGEWIRAEDRLPRVGDEVLAVCVRKIGQNPVRYVGICMKGPAGEWYEVNGAELKDVTHWMELPKLPEVR